MLRLLLIVLTLSLASTRAHAEPDPRRVAVSVELGMGPLVDVQARSSIEAKLGELGYVVLPNDALLAAAASAGALQNGAMVSGATALERVRVASESAAVVRLYTTAASGDRATIRLVVVDKAGARAVEWSATPAEAPGRVPALVDAAWKQPATPVAQLRPAVAPAPAASALVDVIVFKSGAQISGTVTREAAGQSVSLRRPNGVVETYAWADVAQIRRGVTESRTQTTAGASGLTFSQQTGCPPGASPEQCREQTALTADSSGAALQHQADCAPGETEIQCRERLSVGIGQGGLGVGYSQSSVERVHGPRSFALSATVGGNFVYGTGTGDLDVSIVGGGAQLSIGMMFGKFPGPEGGTLLGGFFEPQVAASYFSVSAGDFSSSAQGVRFGGALGLQFINFGRFEESTMKQGGFGLRGGLFLGGDMMAMEDQDPEVQFAWGPTLGLSSLAYNPATAKVTGVDFNLLVLPLDDFLFVMAGVAVKL